MKRFGLVGLLALFAAFAAQSSPARAQIQGQSYASPTGNGVNCTESASSPCPLALAINTIGNGGIVSCINGGAYQLTDSTAISFTVDCPGAVLTGGGSAGSVITLTGTTSQVVILRNLTFDGGPQDGAPFLKVTGGATLIMENCKFQNIANHSAIAIQFTPNSPGAQLIIRDSVFANNGIASSGAGGGLQVAPASGGSASVRLERVSFDFNVTAMVLSGPVNATMIGSVVQASRNTGILVGSGSTLLIEDSKLIYNVGSAVSVSSGGTLHLSNNDIRGNQIGVSNSGGQALSYKNNRFFGNGSTATLGTITGGQ